MNGAEGKDSGESALLTAGAGRDLAEVIAAYTEATARLRRSHERLKAEVRRLRDELEVKNRELRRRERLASLGRMAAGLAHEIRNPLGAIALYASLLQQELAGREDLLDVVSKISSAVEGLNRLVNNILEFARSRQPQRQMVPAAMLMADALAAVQPIVADKSVRVVLPEECGYLFVDPEQMTRALVNLLRNAAEAVEPGGVVLVRIRYCGEGGGIVWVEDDGPGVPESVSERVFEPFVSGKHDGTGLGLAIVHQIVEAHGGRIRLKRSRLGGAKFSLQIPGKDGRDLRHGRHGG